MRRHHTPSRVNRTTKIIGLAVPTIALVCAFVAYQAQPEHADQMVGKTASDQQRILAPGAVAAGGTGSKIRSTAKPHKLAKVVPVRRSRNSTKTLVATSSTVSASAPTTSYAANLDYASGGYGTYSSAALSDSHIGGVDINMNWALVEKSQGSFNWAPLDNTLKAWSTAGKKVVIVTRFANEVGGGSGSGSMLPLWEQSRIPTFLDTKQNALIPDYFNATFQSDWKSYIKALGAHLSASPYKSAVAYVRFAAGLGGESFVAMPSSLSADMPKLQSWGYTPQAWEAWQESMLAFYHSVLPLGMQDVYPVVALPTDPSTGNPIELDVAKYNVGTLAGGIGQEAIPAGSYGSGAGYADINTICSWAHANYPKAYIQFQALPFSQLGSATNVSGTVKNAEAHWARSIEWYESGITNSSYQPAFAALQNWVNSTFKV